MSKKQAKFNRKYPKLVNQANLDTLLLEGTNKERRQNFKISPPPPHRRQMLALQGPFTYYVITEGDDNASSYCSEYQQYQGKARIMVKAIIKKRLRAEGQYEAQNNTK